MNRESLRTGLILLGIGVLVAFSPFIFPDAFGGARIAGWSLMGTLPIGMILGLVGIIPMAVGPKSESDTDNEVSAVDEITDSGFSTDKPEMPQPAAVPASMRLPAVLTPEFGRRQIVLMGAVFVLLLTVSVVRSVTQEVNWVTLALLPFELPYTLGLLVAGALVVLALRLRFNESTAWSPDAYESLYRAQRAFAIPAYLSIVWLLILNPSDYFDPTDVGSAEGVLLNQITGITTIAPTVIAIAASILCSRWRREYLGGSESAGA